MILPNDFIETLVNKLNANLNKFPSGTKFKETSEDSTKNLNPPYGAVYADFDDPAEISNYGIPNEIPVSIYVACHSKNCETAAKSFNQAFLMGVEVLKLLTGNYEISGTSGNLEFTRLKAQNIPLVILRKSASGSIIQVQFNYTLFNIMG